MIKQYFGTDKTFNLKASLKFPILLISFYLGGGGGSTCLKVGGRAIFLE